MFAKLLLTVVVAGATACTLLNDRQMRIDATHQMTTLHRQLIINDQTLWTLRSEIAQRCRIGELRLAIDDLDTDWAPLPETAGDWRTLETRLTDHDATLNSPPSWGG